MNTRTRTSSALLGAVLALLFTGCATTGGERDPRDPFEPFNRAMYKFNDTVDRAVIKPVAQGYDKVVPNPVKTGVRNVFGNLNDIVTLVNDLLQAKFSKAADDWGRVFINTTFGFLGIFDIATDAGLEKNNEDFGQTMGRWGAGSGPYLVLPFLGPSSIRDGVGLIADSPLKYYTNIERIRLRNQALAVDTVSTRASLLGASEVLEEAALDPYVFVRDAYLQRRERLVYDGKPPKEEFDEEEDEPEKPREKEQK